MMAVVGMMLRMSRAQPAGNAEGAAPLWFGWLGVCLILLYHTSFSSMPAACARSEASVSQDRASGINPHIPRAPADAAVEGRRMIVTTTTTVKHAGQDSVMRPFSAIRTFGFKVASRVSDRRDSSP
jgi:hypothetical protein